MKKLLWAVLVLAPVASAQTGLPRFSSVQTGGFDNINRYNLNVEFELPIVSVTGRGINFNPRLVYNSLIWQNGGFAWSPVVDPNGSPSWAGPGKNR